MEKNKIDLEDNLPFVLKYYWIGFIIILVLFGSLFNYEAKQNDGFINYVEDVNEILKEFQIDISELREKVRTLQTNKNLEEELINFDSKFCYLKVDEQDNKDYVTYEYEGNYKECPPDEKYYSERYNSTIEVNIR